MQIAEDGPGVAQAALGWKDRGSWKMPAAAKGETSIAPFGTKFPARKLMTIQALGLGTHAVTFDSRHGRRSVSRCLGGSFAGAGVAGSVAEDVSNEWRLADAMGGDGFAVEGLVTLLADTGETILMKYIGRGGGRIGANSYRVGAVFEAPAATLGWLNSICAAGRVTVDGTALRFDLFELLSRAEDATEFLDVEPLYRMTGLDSVGSRLTIHGAVSNRYFTMAESGCLAEGALQGMWIKGISWGPHRMAFGETSLPWQIDMRVMMETQHGGPVLQQYLGTIPERVGPPEAKPDPSWRTAAVFEADVNSALNWLNDVVAIGVGWKEDNEAHYFYYVMQ